MDKYFASEYIDKYIRETYFKEFEYKGTIIEVGGGDPENISMSRHFKLSGWSVYIIEPNPDLASRHRNFENIVFEVACLDENKDNIEFTILTKYGNSLSCSSVLPKPSYLKVAGYENTNGLKSETIIVNQRTLDTLIRQVNINKIDILSVDVEGYEIEVMKGLTLLDPLVIILENIFDDLEYHKFMDSRGYKLDAKIGENHIYTLK